MRNKKLYIIYFNVIVVVPFDPLFNGTNMKAGLIEIYEQKMQFTQDYIICEEAI